ncbi:site-specific DNA-methyltransferase [Guptibacillus algicola]|uniref:site-specific DNA-methyltransferase n=1 Tax=Guptibacillus algicola TaxID=225844 RepID=UPI001CD4D5CB|nr:site-specific DNA-methyltransferase [Alkalihalobacillus algicola]MCA0986575.1 site-specific DNA-methyltransferase [Alkalihalobacillus algicola]
MSYKKLKKTERTDQERIDKIKELFPEAMGDGLLNIQTLNDLIKGFDIETVSEKDEFYSLGWSGKSKARKLAYSPPTGTLTLKKDNGFNENNASNYLIQGDNLEVLRILKKSYTNQVDTIYIDPPYNTGQDLIYNDKFDEPVESYLQATKQADEQGLLTSNPKSTGRYHANWLNMLYPRVKLAWSLLKEDGIICVSISDIEVANLRKMMDEIFGEENFINTVSVKSKVNAGASGGGEDKKLKKNIEYIHIYAKNIDKLPALKDLYQYKELMQLISEMKDEGQSWKYTSVLVDYGERQKLGTTYDGNGDPIEIYIRKDLQRKSINQIMKEEKISEEEVYRKYLNNIFSDTNAQSSIRQRVIDKCGHLNQGELYEVEYTPRSGKDRGNKVVHHYISNTVRRVIWLADVVDEVDGKLLKKERLSTLWDDIDFNNVGKEGEIPYPNGKKPIELIKRCIRINNKPKGLILDFFAGSGSTGHAVLDMNREDDGDRKFLLIQLPERPNDKEEKFDTIADLAVQRIKNSYKQVFNSELININANGFKVLELNRSNLKMWLSQNDQSVDYLVNKLDLFSTSPFIEGVSEQNIVIELMLNQGFPLNSMLHKNRENIWEVTHERIPFNLYISLQDNINNDVIEFLEKVQIGSLLICTDDSLSDEQKVLLSEKLNVKTI